MSSFDQKLKNLYMSAAAQADRGGYGISGGVVRRSRVRRRAAMGAAMSGGAYGPQYPSRSFPMPGFFPGALSAPAAGAALSGGRSHRAKNPRRVMAGAEAASKNPWLKQVRDYRESHPGVSQKEAMQILGNARRSM